MSPNSSNCTVLLMTGTNGSALELFPWADADTDFPGGHDVAQHLPQHFQLRIGIARKKVTHADGHLVVHLAVRLRDELAVGCERELDFLAVARNWRTGHQAGLDEALHVL